MKVIIREWILLAISIQFPSAPDMSGHIIFANENAPRPNLPYFTINITAMTKIGQVNRLETDDTGLQRSKYDEDISISIQCFGRTSADLLQV